MFDCAFIGYCYTQARSHLARWRWK